MTARTTAAERAVISRQNGRKSRGGGPKTPEGKIRSRSNAVKHGMTASIPVLPGEDESLFRQRVQGFIEAIQPTNAVEMVLTEQAALASWKIARGERAAAAHVGSAIRAAEATAGARDHDEVAALGHWLTAPDLRTKMEAGKALFPFLSQDRQDPFGRGRGEPRHVALRLEATVAGCQWLIDQWAKLRVWLDRGVDWRTNELIAALQLRGQRPLRKDAIEWQGVVEPILPTGNPAAIAEARRRLLSQFDDGLTEDPAGQRAALLRLVDEEMERLLQRKAGHQRREAADRAELADRLAVDLSPAGELMRRYQLDNDRKLDRAINGLVKLRRAGVGVAGDPAADGAPEPEPESVGTVESQGAAAAAPEGQAGAEVQPNAEGDSLEDEDLGAGGFSRGVAPGWSLSPRRGSSWGRPRGVSSSPETRAHDPGRRQPRSARRTQPGRGPWRGRRGELASRARPIGSWRGNSAKRTPDRDRRRSDRAKRTRRAEADR